MITETNKGNTERKLKAHAQGVQKHNFIIKIKCKTDLPFHCIQTKVLPVGVSQEEEEEPENEVAIGQMVKEGAGVGCVFLKWEVAEEEVATNEIGTLNNSATYCTTTQMCTCFFVTTCTTTLVVIICNINKHRKVNCMQQVTANRPS